jgi:putative salt-induced outer membrane protein YdiY
MNSPWLNSKRPTTLGLAVVLSSLLFGSTASAQMNWMFGSPSDPAAPPVNQVDFTDLGLLDASGAQPVGSSIAPLPAPAPPALAPPASAPPPTITPETIVTQEPLPLAEQTQRWYSYPWMWAWKGWTNSAEFGLNASEGNTNTLSLQTGTELKRETDKYTFGIDFDYFRTKTGGEVTQDNGRVNFDYDRLLGKSRWSAFAKLGLEWNEFRPFDLRLNMNGGAGYHWFRTDESTIVTRFGAGASREIGAPDDSWTPEALFGVEAEQQITSQQKLKAKIDYFPNWGDFSDYRLVSDISWEILLDDSDNLSLKLAATNRYDSTPQGALPRDLFYSMLLLYKF